MDPKLLAQLLAALGQQESANIESALEPRGRIARAPEATTGLAGWYALNPQARQGESYAQEQTRIKSEIASRNQLEKMDREIAFRNKKAELDKARGVKKPSAANAVVAGFGNWVQGLFGGGNQTAAKGKPAGGAGKRAANLEASQANSNSGLSPAMPVQPFQSADPQIQNLMELGGLLKDFKTANPGAATAFPSLRSLTPDGPAQGIDPYEGLVPMPVDQSRVPVSQRLVPFNWNSINTLQDLLPQRSLASSKPEAGQGAPPLTEWLPSLGLPDLPPRPAAAPYQPRLAMPNTSAYPTVTGNQLPMPNTPVGPLGAWPSSNQIMQEIIAGLHQPRAYNGTQARPQFNTK